MATPITLNQMLKRPVVIGAFSRVKETGTFFQRFFGMSPDAPNTENFGFQTTAAYDIFDHSATMAQARPPKVGPAKIARKPIGQAYTTVCRFYEALTLDYEDVYGTRPIGGDYGGPLDGRGETYIAKQLMYQAERQANAMEFMISRMFRGGFSIGLTGDNYVLGELGAGGASIDITFPIPSANKTQIAAGSGGSIIDATWANSGTKILNHLYLLNKAAERQCGYPIRHVFMNSTTWLTIIGNTQLATVRGSSMRLFESFSTDTTSTTGDPRESGFSFRLPAAPQFSFHVYDGVSVVATQTDPDDRTSSNTSLFIPDNVAIFTPEPDLGGWYGKATREEPIKETDDGAVQVVEGLHSWSYGTNDPPGEELRILNNFVPVLYVPKALFYGTVIF